MEWMPIESAPKDGSEIIICLLGHAVSARWVEHEPGYIDKGWLTIESRESYLSEDAPTHWMPLPDPPATPIGPIPTIDEMFELLNPEPPKGA